MDEGRADGIGRRTVLGGVAAVAAGAMACDREDAPAPESAKELPPEAEALFRDLVPGTKVEQWTIVAVHPVRHGALPVVLAGADGQHFQVDVMAVDPGGPLGVANTKTLSLFVANRGDGNTPPEESQGLGAMALAAAHAGDVRQASRSAPGRRVRGPAGMTAARRPIEVTLACDGACRFCAQVGLQRVDRGLDVVGAEVRRAGEAGEAITFVGGEPTTRAELAGWIAAAREAGAPAVGLQTHARARRSSDSQEADRRGTDRCPGVDPRCAIGSSRRPH